MSLLIERIIQIVIGTVGIAVLGLSVASTLFTKVNAAANSDNQVVTIATKDQLPGTKGPNFLYGRGMVTTHQSDSSYNGRLYATSENYVTGTPTFKIFESTNHGATWSKVSEVQDTQHGWGMRYQPYLYELPEQIGDMPAGTLICAGNAIPSDMSKTSIDLYKSTDHGRTWRYLSTVAQGGTATTTTKGNGPVWEPFVKVIDHQLVTFYSDERDKPAHSQLLAHETSTDGIHWSSQVNDVVDSNPAGRPGMATVAQMANGKYIMTYEVAGEGGNHSNFKISNDGLNWNASDMGTKFADGGSPYVTTLNDGTVVANSTGGNVYVNTNNGVGNWTSVNTPMAGAYSRSLTPLANGQLLMVSGGGYAGPTSNANHTLTSMVWDLPMQYHRATVQFANQPASLAAGETANFTVKLSNNSAGDFDVTTDDLQNVTVEKQSDGSYRLRVNANFVGQKEVTVTATKKGDSSLSANFKVNITGQAPTPDRNSTNAAATGSITPPSSNEQGATTTSSAPESNKTKQPTTKKFKSFKVYAKRAIRVYQDVNLKRVVKSYHQQVRMYAPVFTVIGQATAKNGALRYRTTAGYITANRRYVAKLYYQATPKKVTILAKAGAYEYPKPTFSKASRTTHLKKGMTVKVKKLVKLGSVTKLVLNNGHYLTANKKLVLAKP
ncbi:hypothetical protein YK48G_19380 [Lentilactobacillus fungorum]|uniref:DUF5776 domain-containing protein n=1 Tax=Lentilactobacillus fungorum TaxID=2201250 RepID=A0ABQ3W1L3_9LACO|nr:DUF5776 domain-containing protein [Lentilactobacillus fungorum]GHP14513.1 hypothetical protein YK48G_19380 [Lentilactobacillus fungorum]